MKIVVMGGTGLIGKQLVNQLSGMGHAVIAGSPASGIDAITGEGLNEAFAGADVIADVTNAPLFKGEAASEFFETAGRNILEAAKRAGVKHQVVLSVVGTDRLQESGYFRAKQVQENLASGSGIPYTIVRSAQFFEFIGAIARAGVSGDVVRMSSAFIQPAASADVVSILAAVITGKPVNGIVEAAGPDKFRLDELVRKYLSVMDDDREVVTDGQALYFGAQLQEGTLVPGGEARLGATHYADWISKPENQRLLK